MFQSKLSLSLSGAQGVSYPKDNYIASKPNIDADSLILRQFTNGSKSITIRFTNIRELLSFFMEQIGIKSPTILHRYLGVNKEILLDILNGDLIFPKRDVLEKIANYFNLTMPQVMGDEDIQLEELPNINSVTRTVAVITMGDLDEWLYGNKCLVDVSKYIHSSILGFDIFALHIADDSLMPDFLAKSNLIVDRDLQLSTGKFALLYDSIEMSYFISEMFCDANKPLEFRIAGSCDIKTLEYYIKIVGVVIQDIHNI